MIRQLRTYTINKGIMESWLKLFNEKLIPKQKESGIGIQTVWINEEQTQIFGIRKYNSKENIEEKEAKLYGSDWWKENVDFILDHHENREIVLIEPILPDRA